MNVCYDDVHCRVLIVVQFRSGYLRRLNRTRTFFHLLKGISSSRRYSFLTRLEVLVSIHIIEDQENLFQAEFDSDDREIKISFGISSIEMKFSLLKDMSESVELNDPAEVDSTSYIASVPPTSHDDPRWQTSLNRTATRSLNRDSLDNGRGVHQRRLG